MLLVQRGADGEAAALRSRASCGAPPFPPPSSADAPRCNTRELEVLPCSRLRLKSLPSPAAAPRRRAPSQALLLTRQTWSSRRLSTLPRLMSSRCPAGDRGARSADAASSAHGAGRSLCCLLASGQATGALTGWQEVLPGEFRKRARNGLGEPFVPGHTV
jgi:hypothetical protein